MRRFLIATFLAIAAIEQPLLIGRGFNITSSAEILPTPEIAEAKTALFYYKQGNEKIKLGDYQGAIADFSKSIELNPNVFPSYFSRGVAKLELGDYPGSIEDFNKAIELNPNLFQAYKNRGITK